MKTGVAPRLLTVKDTERATTNLVPSFSLSRSVGTGKREHLYWERGWATTHSRPSFTTLQGFYSMHRFAHDNIHVDHERQTFLTTHLKINVF